MDASKLANILIDLSSIKEEDDINEKLQELSNRFSIASSKEPDLILDELKNLLSQSLVNYYSPSNLKILEEIDGLQYFGDVAYRKILGILDDNMYNNNVIHDELELYINERKTYITLIEETRANLKSLGIEPHFSNNEFEIGLLMPNKLTDSKIVNITKELKEWDKVIKTFKELNNETPEDTKIDFVNNGSIDFFIYVDEHVATCLAFVIERIIKTYKNIVIIKKKKEELRALGALTQVEKKEIEKNEKEIFNNSLDQLAKDVIQQFASKNIETGRLNEIKVAVKGHIKYVAKCINGEMIIEITPPEIDQPAPIKTDDTEAEKNQHEKSLKEYNSTLKKIEIVQKSMEVVKSIGKSSFEIMKYLNDGEEPKEDDEEPKEDNSKDEDVE